MSSSALQEIVALLGCPAAGNPSQYLFERAIEAVGLDWRFVTCDVAVDDAAASLAGAHALGFRGCLVSGPLREIVPTLVSPSTPSVAFAGAASLLERRDGGLVAHMTDGRGIVEAVRAHADPAGRAAVVIGAGACGRAAALELAVAGATEVLVCDPNHQRAQSLADALAATAPATAVDWLDIVVPAHAAVLVITPTAAPTGAAVSGLRRNLVVADALLAGRPSPLAVHAAAEGCCVVDGIEVHAVQSTIDFQTLTGIVPDTEMLHEALEEFFSA
ncbi:MAG: shikimate dehydrogenase family protein [Planctomycetota bacterium]